MTEARRISPAVAFLVDADSEPRYANDGAREHLSVQIDLRAESPASDARCPLHWKN